jgi:hypothetical protein
VGRRAIVYPLQLAQEDGLPTDSKNGIVRRCLCLQTSITISTPPLCIFCSSVPKTGLYESRKLLLPVLHMISSDLTVNIYYLIFPLSLVFQSGVSNAPRSRGWVVLYGCINCHGLGQWELHSLVCWCICGWTDWPEMRSRNSMVCTFIGIVGTLRN